MSLAVTVRDAVCELRLDAPPGNILDRATCMAMAESIREHAANADLKAFLLTAAGANFSYGASVEEHVAGEVERFLPAFHDVFHAFADAAVPVVAAVQGLCLGGAFELVSFANFVVAERAARFGVPEITLGVFPPAACVLLPWRLGGAAAEALVLGGRPVGAESCGLVNVTCPEGALEAATEDLLDKRIRPHSAAALRLGVRAMRGTLYAELRARLPALEALYLKELMATRDAREGIDAFLAKAPSRVGERMKNQGLFQPRDWSLQGLVEESMALLEDPDCPTVQRWREAGGKVCGHFQVYFPEEIAHAAGLLPVRIRGGSLDPLRAESRFGSYLCSIIKTSLELALRGPLQVDMFVTHPICDAARNLAAIWSRNFEAQGQILYLPQNPNSPGSRDYLRHEYARLRRTIEEVAGALRDRRRVARVHRRLQREPRAAPRALRHQARTALAGRGAGRLRAHGRRRLPAGRGAQRQSSATRSSASRTPGRSSRTGSASCSRAASASSRRSTCCG